MKRAELQKGAVYTYDTGANWRSKRFVLVLDTEPWYEYSSHWRSPHVERFRRFTGGYGQSKNGVLVAELSMGYGGYHLDDRTWTPAIAQLRAIKSLVCPADGDLRATFQTLDDQRRQANIKRDLEEQRRAERYVALKDRASAVIEELGLTEASSYLSTVQQGMAKVEVDRGGNSAQVTIRVEDLEKLLAQLSDRDKDLYQYEQI